MNDTEHLNTDSIFSIMLFPQNEQMRAAYLTHQKLVHAKANWEDLSLPEKAIPDNNELKKKVIKATKSGWYAGLILSIMFLRSHDKHLNHSKYEAIKTLVKWSQSGHKYFGNQDRFVRSETSYKDASRNLRLVSHLWAAHVISESKIFEVINTSLRKSPDRFFELAKYIQEFILCYQEKSIKSTDKAILLDPKSKYLINDNIPPLKHHFKCPDELY